jgi:hypothetical protein
MLIRAAALDDRQRLHLAHQSDRLIHKLVPDITGLHHETAAPLYESKAELDFFIELMTRIKRLDNLLGIGRVVKKLPAVPA